MHTIIRDRSIKSLVGAKHVFVFHQAKPQIIITENIQKWTKNKLNDSNFRRLNQSNVRHLSALRRTINPVIIIYEEEKKADS